MRRFNFRLTATFIIALAAGLLTVAKAQFSVPASTDSVISVSLLTAAPGQEVYQLEGHSGLRFQTTGSDFVANWGLFDFHTPNFVYRFVKGETDYCVGICPTTYFIMEYLRENRRLTEQVLNLRPDEAQRLMDAVLVAVRPENRTYRYNYVLDNCATRPIAFVEKAMGDTIRFPKASEAVGEATTFRKVMRHFHRNYPWYQFGIDLALGSGIDYPISRRQAVFAPVVLEEIAASATIGGDSIPLVKDTRILVPGEASGPVLPPTPWYLTPLTAMWTLAGLCIATTFFAIRRRKMCKLWMATYFSVIGLAGCVVAFLVCISTHEATAPNWIILWVNPLSLLFPLLLWWKKCRPALRLYAMANLALIAIYGITCMFGTQSANMAFLPLALSDAVMTLQFLKLNGETNG